MTSEVDAFIAKYSGGSDDIEAEDRHPVSRILDEASQALMDHMVEHSDAELDPALNQLHADIASLAIAIDRRAFVDQRRRTA